MNDSGRKHIAIPLALLLLWAGFLLWASLTPYPPSPSSRLLSWDKFQHATAYALLTLMAGHLFSRLRALSDTPWLFAFFAAVLYGGVIEVAQESLTAARRAEWGDIVADATGALLTGAAVRIRALIVRQRTS